MGRHCGFYFYRMVDKKFEKANIIHYWPGENDKTDNWLNIDGRGDATDIFLRLVKSKSAPAALSWFETDIKPEEKYFPYLLLNHQELDGFEEHKNEYGEWFDKYFYIGLDKFKSCFDFDNAQKEHDDSILGLKEKITEYKNEIELLRAHQENASTKVAFNCFEEKIQEIKDRVVDTNDYIKDIEEDDYDYKHYMWIKKDIEQIESIISEDPDIIVVAYAND